MKTKSRRVTQSTTYFNAGMRKVSIGNTVIETKLFGTRFVIFKGSHLISQILIYCKNALWGMNLQFIKMINGSNFLSIFLVTATALAISFILYASVVLFLFLTVLIVFSST